jgi:prokaryotic ubiquitin-like protein Pup
MADRDSTGRQAHVSRTEEQVDDVAATEEAQSDVKERHEKLSDDVDSLLDEIDDVLEENAEEFVRGYVQKGGQ